MRVVLALAIVALLVGGARAYSLYRSEYFAFPRFEDNTFTGSFFYVSRDELEALPATVQDGCSESTDVDPVREGLITAGVIYLFLAVTVAAIDRRSRAGDSSR